MSAYESTALREDEFVYYEPNLVNGMETASLKAIQQQPLLMYPPKYLMYRTLKTMLGTVSKTYTSVVAVYPIHIQ